MSSSLPHNCRIGKISVHPKDWDQPGASVKEDWYVHYRFHDPNYQDKYPKGYLVKIRGMNDQKSLAERRRVTRGLIEDEKGKLTRGLNPILKKIVPDIRQDYLVHPTTPFIRALEEGRKMSNVDRGTKEGMKTVIKYVTAAAMSCGLHNVPVQDIRRRHLMKILQVCGEQKKTWSNELYNFYVKYLGMLFKPLVKAEATEVNATNGLELMKKTERVKAVLSLQQRKTVNSYCALANSSCHAQEAPCEYRGQSPGVTSCGLLSDTLLWGERSNGVSKVECCDGKFWRCIPVPFISVRPVPVLHFFQTYRHSPMKK